MENLTTRGSKADDAEIISKINFGDPALFEILIRRNNSALYKIARSYGFNHQDAEDLMQETHVAAYQNLKQFKFKSSYKTWISKIMINKCLYKLNHGYQNKEFSFTDRFTENDKPLLNNNNKITPESVSLNTECMKLLEQAIEKLPVIYRSVFILREVEGFSVAETADLLDITETNVKVRLNRSKTLLQKELEKFYSRDSLYEFNLVYCDKIVSEVFKRI